MPALRLLPAAIDDLERLVDFLRAKSPQAAARAVAAILRGADLLQDAPRLGRPLADGTGRRELYIPFAASGYVLRYYLEDDETAVIIRIWHSRESRE